MPGYRKFHLTTFVLITLIFTCFQPVSATNKSAYDEPNFQIDIGECTWNGTKSMTSVTFTLTNTKAEVYLPSGAYFPLTMSRPVITVDLESGIYNYVWWDDFDPTFYTWLTRVEGSFTLDSCQPQASASVSVGECSWSESSGSVTPVTINLDHASLTLNGMTYTATQTIITDLAPGSYFYSWFGINGYAGGESNRILTIPDCTPKKAVVEVKPGTCSWSTAVGPKTDVVFSISGAELTLTGPAGPSGPYTSNTTLPLEPGHYTYSWSAQTGYFGVGNGSFDLVDCTPDYGTASVVPGACSWDENKGSTFVATITLENAWLTIDGTTYQSSDTVELACGKWHYIWGAKDGYQGGAEGDIEVEGCEPTDVEVHVGSCGWTGSASMTPVTLDITGATLTLYNITSGTPVLVDQYGPGSHTVSLPTGSYSYSWEPNTDFANSGSGTFDTLDCEPGKADASVGLGACAFDQGKSLTLVSINVNGAVLTIDNQDYIDNAEIKLEPGSYYYSWKATTGYEGSGDGTLEVKGCEPASVDVILGACDWLDATSITPVTLEINGATLTLFSDVEGVLTPIGEYGHGSHTVSLPMGAYSYSWVANENFTGSGDGTFETLDCEPGKADATIVLGACTYDNEQSLTVVSIFINGAVLTIDDQEFFENAELKLEPGQYPYSWKAAGKEFDGSGQGVLVVGSCDPKGGEDPSPDVAAGGTGPRQVFNPITILIAWISLGFEVIYFKLKRQISK